MKYRSPLSLVVLTITTLGLYDLYWILSTSRAMKERGIRVGNPWPHITYRLLWLIFILASIAGISFNLAMHYQHRGDISAECWHETLNHAVTSLPGHGMPSVISEGCNRQLDDYEHIKEINRWVVPIVFITFAWSVLSPIQTIRTKNWFSKYCYGLEALTGRAYSATQIALFLMLLPVGTGQAIVQQEMNKRIKK